MLERIQKFLSASGIASRRKAEEFIKSGQVSVNGHMATLGQKIDASKDIVKVYGKLIQPSSQKIYILLNKPKGYVVTKKDPQARKTIYSLLPADLRSKVWSIGRLDFESEGLIILTNDGALTQELSHPKFEHEKEYEILCDKEPTKNQVEKLRAGILVEDEKTYALNLKQKGKSIQMTIKEGKNRQIRKMLNSIGLGVSKLNRIRVNKLILPKNLPPGKYKIIKKTDILPQPFHTL